MGKQGKRQFPVISPPSYIGGAKIAARHTRLTPKPTRVKHKACGGELSPIERVVRLRWCEKCCVEIGVEGWKCVD